MTGKYPPKTVFEIGQERILAFDGISSLPSSSSPLPPPPPPALFPFWLLAIGAVGCGTKLAVISGSFWLRRSGGIESTLPDGPVTIGLDGSSVAIVTGTITDSPRLFLVKVDDTNTTLPGIRRFCAVGTEVSTAGGGVRVGSERPAGEATEGGDGTRLGDEVCSESILETSA